jgi:hypothetical protein
MSNESTSKERIEKEADKRARKWLDLLESCNKYQEVSYI